MYPRTLLFLSFVFLFSSISFSQNERIKGQVFLFNSKAEQGSVQQLEDVKIFSPLSKSVYSDEKGRFDFLLKGIFPSKPIFIQVQKKGYEVVDNNDLRYFISDSKPRLRIFLTKIGYQRQARKELLDIGTETLRLELEEYQELFEDDTNMRRLAVGLLNEKTGLNLRSVREAEDFLEEWRERVTENFRFTSFELSVINPDFASTFFNRAMDQYRQNDMESTLAVLQEEDLDRSYESLLNKVEKIKNRPKKVYQMINSKFRRFDQLKENYVLQIVACLHSFRLKEGRNALNKLAQLNEIAPTHKHTLFLEKMNFFNEYEPMKKEESLAHNKRMNSSFYDSDLEIRETPSKNTFYHGNEKLSSTEGKISKRNMDLENEEAVALEEDTDNYSNEDQPYNVSFKNLTQNDASDQLLAAREKLKMSNARSSSVSQSIQRTPNRSNSSDPIGSVPSDYAIASTRQTSTFNLKEEDVAVRITITTDNEIIIEKTNAGEAIKIDRTSPPQEITNDQLVMKGTPTKSVKDAKIEDFETILFPIKNATNYFKAFVEEEKKE